MNIVPVRVAVQASRRLVRDALAGCLADRPDFTIVGRTARWSDLPELCLLRRPGALLAEAGGSDGWIAAISTVRAHHPTVNVVVVYQSMSPAEMVRAYRAGVTSLVPHSRGLDAVVAALKAGPGPVRTATTVAPRGHRTGRTLTDRELQIMALICAGHSVREIAAMLAISPRTVENHKRRIYDKLNVHSQSQAVSHAVQLGLVAPADPDGAGRVQPAQGEEVGPSVVIQGPDGPVRDAVARVLTAGDVPFGVNLVEPTGTPASITVLVDPQPGDWAAAEATTVVVVHAGPADQALTVDAVLRGAGAILPADRIGDRLMPVLAAVRTGCLAMDRAQARGLFRALRACLGPVHPAVPTMLPALTVREHDILRSIARGDTVRQTARALGISVKTVENTQGRLYQKLGARNRASALTVAYGFGLVEPD